MNNAGRCIAFQIIQSVSHAICLFPVRENRIVFMSHRGASQYADSPKYISEYLQCTYPGKYEIIWIVNDLSKFVYLKKKQIKIVRHKTLLEFFYLNTAKVSVTNCGFGPYLIKRRGQLRIHTLHGGGAYKSNILVDNGEKYQEIRSNIYNLMLSGCRLSTECNIIGDFKFKGDVMECGMPRNDIFFEDNAAILKKVKNYFGLNKEHKILLLAPTWREDNDDNNMMLNYERLSRLLSRKYGGEWKILLRTHHLSHADVSGSINQYQGIVLDARKYPDVQELLCSADILITDYSSLLWDYALRGMPILLFVPDLIKYEDDRGFNVPVKEWGLYYAETEEELFNIIQECPIEELRNASSKHLQIFGSYETGHATENVCKKIYECTTGGRKKI